MHSDLATQAAMTALRCVVVLVSHRSLMKSLAIYMSLFTATIIMQPVSARAGDFPNISKSPEQLMSPTFINRLPLS
jgi:hypothetical protein